MTETQNIEAEALALVEIEGMPHAVLVQDAALKKAPIRVLACAPVSPGQAILIFAGDVASVEESLGAVLELCGNRRKDHLFLPGIHQDVLRALLAERRVRNREALAVLETNSAASTISAADNARKATAVQIGRLHLATGFGGRAFFTIFGAQSEVEAAVEVVQDSAGERLLDYSVIPAPHDELPDGAFRRPWPLDPAGVDN